MSTEYERFESSKIAEQEQIEKDTQRRIDTLKKVGNFLEEISDRMYVTATVPQQGIVMFTHENETVILNRETLKSKLQCSLMGIAENQEYLRKVPHEKIEDIAVVARFHVNDEASFVVTNALCQQLCLTSSEVMEMAHANTSKQEYSCINMADMLRGLMELQDMSPDYAADMTETQKNVCPMYVLTNQSRVDGALALTSVKALDDARQKLGEDFYVLPSSRHELILIPQKFVDDVKVLEDMVKEVNATEVRSVDKLTDSVYRYHGESKKFSKVDSRIQTEAKSHTATMTKSHTRTH